MHPIYNYLRHRKDVSLLLAAFLLLVIALFNPTIPIKRNIYSYIFAVDISQSMNVVDQSINGKAVSRLAYTQDTLQKLISELPCGTNISIGLFAGVSVAALYTPIEVCENFDAINDTIDHLDWRMGWSGNSRIRGSLPVLAKTVRSFPAPAQVVFFTDGEEAPKLHVFNREDLSAFQGGDDWLIVGVGSDKGTPIPKFDEKNQLIGYWANESFAMQPGIAQISESNIGSRNDSVANGESDRYLSKLDETYLQDLAKEINGMYVRADSVSSILNAMKKQKPVRRDHADFELRWILAAVAGVLFTFAYLPKHPLNELKTQWRSLTNRRRVIQEKI